MIKLFKRYIFQKEFQLCLLFAHVFSILKLRNETNIKTFEITTNRLIF